MRSTWKYPYFSPSFTRRLLQNPTERRRPMTLSHRRLRIDASMVSRFVRIPNGRRTAQLGISPAMVGRVLGEFVPTRVPVLAFRKKRAKALEKKLKEERKKAGASRATNTGAVDALRQKRKSQKLWVLRGCSV
jgi:ribosomal protein S19